MNPEIAKLYKWSVKQGEGGRWEAGPLVCSAPDSHWFLDRVEALNYATAKARENAGQRVLMALMLAVTKVVK